MSVLMHCGTSDLPKNISYGISRLSGSLVATCSNCNFVCAYWDCPCELEHECAKEKN